MQKIIILCFVFLSIGFHLTFAQKARELQGYTPSYEEDYGSSIDYGNSGSGNSGSSSSNSGSSSGNSGSGNSYGSGYGGNTPSYEEKYEEELEEEYEEKYEEEYEEEYEKEYEEEYEEEYEKEYEEEYEEEYEQETYEQNNNYGSYTPSYEEEYGNNQTYYGGYGSTSTYEENNQEQYETPSYGYGGNPSYNNAANETYTQEYEEAYGGGGNVEGESGESGSGSGSATPNIPFVPTSLLTGFVVDIHFLAGDPRFQYIAYHYCSDLYPGYTQCDIYNGTSSNSRLMGVEIVVSAEIFAQLPMQERKYWHSHAFGVKSGLIVSPNTPPEQELAVMSSIMNSYGKVTDFFHSYQSFPYGGAKLAFGLADESQVNETIAQQLDRDLNLTTTWKQRAEQRKDLQPTIIQGANDYLNSGEFPQYVTQMFPVAAAQGTGGSTGAVTVGPEDSGEDSNSS